MKLTVHAAISSKKIESDLESGILNLKHLNLYDDLEGEGAIAFEGNAKISQVNKCIEYAEEMGAESLTICFDMSYDNAILLGKHLIALGKKELAVVQGELQRQELE